MNREYIPGIFAIENGCVLAHTSRITANKLLAKLSSQFNITMLLILQF